MEAVLFSGARICSGEAVLVTHPGGEYALGGDLGAFDGFNDLRRFVLVPPADSLVELSTRPTGRGPFDESGLGRRGEEMPLPSEPPRQRQPPQTPPIDTKAFVRRYVAARQFLPPDFPANTPVRLFTLSDCTNRLAALGCSVRTGTGSVLTGVRGFGTRQFRRAQAVLTERNGVSDNGRDDVPGRHVASSEEAYVAGGGRDRTAESGSQVEVIDWRARKLYFSTALDARAHWSFALYEVRAEAEQRRKERRWRDIAALALDSTGQAATAVKNVVEAAFRRLADSPGEADVMTVISDLQSDLAAMQQWLRTERAFTGEYAQAVALNGYSLLSSSATRASPSPSPASNEYPRLLEKHPGARRFLKRIAALDNIGDGEGASTAGHVTPPP